MADIGHIDSNSVGLYTDCIINSLCSICRKIIQYLALVIKNTLVNFLFFEFLFKNKKRNFCGLA